MQELLAHPAVQSLAAPLLAGLVAAIVLHPVRLGGLAAAAGFFTAVYLTGNLSFDPLHPTRKLLLIAFVAPLLGAVADLAFRPTRAAGAVLGVIFGVAAFWVFLTVIGQMPPQRLVLHAVGLLLLVTLTVSLCFLSHTEPVRAGAAGVGLGLGVGISALIGGSKLFGLLGIALGAGAAGLLLIAMILGRHVVAGASFSLSIGVIASLLAAGTVLLGRLPWYYAAAFALVPLAVRLPVAQRSRPAAQGVVALLYALLVAGGVCALVWMAKQAG